MQGSIIPTLSNSVARSAWIVTRGFIYLLLELRFLVAGSGFFVAREGASRPPREARTAAAWAAAWVRAWGGWWPRKGEGGDKEKSRIEGSLKVFSFFLLLFATTTNTTMLSHLARSGGCAQLFWLSTGCQQMAGKKMFSGIRRPT